MSFLNKKIIDFSGTAMGLNISDLSVRIVQLEKDGKKEKVFSYSSSQISPGSVVDGEIAKKDQVVIAINNALKKAVPKKIKTKKVICSLPETKAFLRLISIPKMDKKEVREAIKWEIEANIPLTLDQVYYDWQILEQNISQEKSKMDVLVVVIAKKTVDQFIEVLELAGLEVVGLEVESIAQARCLIDEKNSQRAVLIIDMDERRTGFFVSSNGIPCFTSSVPISGYSITNSISKALGISIDEAEKVKNNHGIGSEFKNSEIFSCVKPVLENLIAEIERSIDFFTSELKYAENIDQIILCGKEAGIGGIGPYLSRRLGRRIELGNPWTNMSNDKKLPQIDRYESVEYSTAIGLALRGLEYEDIY